MQIMAGRIQQEFNRIRASGRKALIPYLTVGFPDLETTVSLVETVVEAGADLVELGVPFSDPLADGVTIQRSTLHALRSGVTLDDCLAVVRKLRSRGVRIPIILMGYYNPILHYGLEEFTQAALQSEVDGLIVVDLPTEESWPLREACREKRISMIPLLAPTSTDERIAAACQHAEGFIYCVSLTGVTGARGELTSGVPELVRRARQHTDLPVVVGFGVSKREHVEAIETYADGVAVGSAIIDVLEQAPPGGMLKAGREFVLQLRGSRLPAEKNPQ